ncbi:hypothetical protein [Thalassotalea aquiviva]
MTAKKRQPKRKPSNHKVVNKQPSWKDNIFFYTIGVVVLLVLVMLMYV